MAPKIAEGIHLNKHFETYCMKTGQHQRKLFKTIPMSSAASGNNSQTAIFTEVGKDFSLSSLYIIIMLTQAFEHLDLLRKFI